MRKMFLLFALIVSFSFAVSPVAMAQNNVDLESVSKNMMDADLETLLEDLKTPIGDDLLPEGFSDATFADSEAESEEEGVLPVDDLEGFEDSITYMIDWEPTEDSATATADRTPSEDPLADFNLTFRLATINYLFFDDEISSNDLDDFKSRVEESLVEEDGAETSVETIDINGTDAVLLTYILKDEGLESVVQMIALPVGNAMVISMLVEAGAEVDGDVVQTAAQELVLSGADYLGTVAEGAR